ncbi:MAG: hypothetical protein PHI18_07400, partial [bacterium]|nr:hypothetical protein [bacterium]
MGRFCVAALFFAAALLIASAPPVAAQTASLEAQLQSLYEQIASLKAAEQEIPADLYQRYFEIEAQLYPVSEERPEPSATDEERREEDSCPGVHLDLPAVNDSVIVAGETYLLNDMCTACRGNGARDAIYNVDIPTPTRLLIKLCYSSGFDTYLCVFRDVCCHPDYRVARNDDSPICGENSFKSAINFCFEDSGRYYIVVDGYDLDANGHFRLAIINLGNVDCGPTPHFDCPDFYTQHEEPVEGVESVCGQSFAIPDPCPSTYCGIIEPMGDVDVYSFTLNECKVVTLRVFANDTYGHYGYFEGLDPVLRLFSGPACDHVLYENDNVGGQVEGLPWEDDSQIITACLRPGTYYAEVTGGETVGSYEFTTSCLDCPAVSPIGPVQVASEGE